MERSARSTKLNLQIYEEACEWFVEFRGGEIDTTKRRELDQWLRKSPEHLRAYLEIAAIWNEGPGLDPTHKWDDATLRREAAGEVDNVFPHPSQSRVGSSPAVHTASVVHGRGRRWLALAASVLLVGVGGWLYSERNVYATGIGEQRSIRLADGSAVDLNSRSKIEVRYSRGERAIELVEGQALFQVARDADRPFIVASGDTRVRAIGTQFDVNRRKSGTIVTVLEGRVAVVSAHDAEGVPAVVERSGEKGSAAPKSEMSKAAPVYLSAGEQLSVMPSDTLKPVMANVAAAMAWKQRQLVFESATLAEVAEEFNRYNDRQLVIEDADLYEFHISGVFSTSEPRGLLDFLRSRPGVEVTETAGGYRVAKKSS